MAYRIVDVEKLQKTINKKQNTINKRSRKMKTKPKTIQIGWFRESGKYNDQPGQIPVQEVARIHEYGLGNHSEKAMLRITQDRIEKTAQRLVDKLIKEQIRAKGKADLDFIAEQVGKLVKDELQQTVWSLDLVDTERLVNSILVKYRRR